MFDGRIYRAALVPLLLVIVIAGFSLVSRSASLGSTLAPDAFNGARAYAGLQAMVKRFPDRRPGSSGDDALASYVARSLGELGSPSGAGATGGPSSQGAADGGFQVSTRRAQARTIEGERTLTTVIAERPGSTGESPIVILAHRDAVGRGSAAELSGTAALLELARVFSQSETRRTIVLVSTSGGSGGYGGAADFAAHWGHPLDAALVLGDLAGAVARRPFVLPFSEYPSTAPEGLQRTLDSAISQEAGVDPGNLGAAAEFAHFAFPLATGEEAPLNSAGVPAVLLQVSGQRGPSAGGAGERGPPARLRSGGPQRDLCARRRSQHSGVLPAATAGQRQAVACMGDQAAGPRPALGAPARERGRARPPAPPSRAGPTLAGVGLDRRASVLRRRRVRLLARSPRDRRGALRSVVRRVARRRRVDSGRDPRVRPCARARPDGLASAWRVACRCRAALDRRGRSWRSRSCCWPLPCSRGCSTLTPVSCWCRQPICGRWPSKRAGAFRFEPRAVALLAVLGGRLAFASPAGPLRPRAGSGSDRTCRERRARARREAWSVLWLRFCGAPPAAVCSRPSCSSRLRSPRPSRIRWSGPKCSRAGRPPTLVLGRSVAPSRRCDASQRCLSHPVQLRSPQPRISRLRVRPRWRAHPPLGRRRRPSLVHCLRRWVRV